MKRQRRVTWLPVVLGACCLVLTASLAQAQVPALIRYQGQAVDEKGVPLEGPYTLTFRLYDAETGGTKVWEEVQPAVPLRGGHFSVLLGSVTSLDRMNWDKPSWLAVQVNTEHELEPRQQLTSVPMALTAERLADSYTISPVNLLKNGSFESWDPDGKNYANFSHWFTNGQNYGLTKRSEEVARFGATSAKLIYDGGGHFGNVSQMVDDFAPLRGQSVTFSVWVYAPRSDALFLVLEIADGVTSTYHPQLRLDSATWQRFTITHVVSPQATKLELMIGQEQPPPSEPSTERVLYVDGAMLVAGPMPFAFSPHPADAHPDISVRVTHSRPIETPSDIDTALPFDTERWDTANLHEETTPTRLTAPASGKYYIFGNVEFSANGAGQRQAKLVVNGSNVIAGITIPSASPWQTWLNVSTYYELQAGDYVALYVHHTGTGGSLTVFKRSSVSPEFGMVKLD